MSEFLRILKAGGLLADGATGTYLFERTGRLSELNHVYESFNANRPELVEELHLAYLAAGAQCLKTNTFGANRTQLRAFNLEHRVAELNRAAVQVARRAVERFERGQPGRGPFFVLASVGPASEPATTPAAVAACYREQLESLVAAGADALLLETFGSLATLEPVLELVRAIPGAPPVIAELTIEGGRNNRPLEPSPADFLTRMAAHGVAVAGVNCCAPWDATAFVEVACQAAPVRAGALELVVMPNAGGFQRIGNRLMTSVNPEFVGKLARQFRDRGVRLIGGCCEMHPPHIAEMHNYLHARQAGGRVVSVAAAAAAARPPAGAAEKRDNGAFSRKVLDRQFAVSVELLPPRGTDDKPYQAKIDFVARLAASGLADALDITDGSRGIPLLPPGDFIHLLRQRLGWTAATGDGLELIPHFTARDLNIMGIQSRLVGYHVHRVRNVIFITGDPPKMSPTYPRSTAVFDVDSVAMIKFAHACLNAGVDFGGAPLGKQADPRTRFTIGTGFEPEALDAARERDRLRQKIDNGADYIMTQPAFHAGPLAALEPFRDQCRILVGVMILAGLEHARRVSQVPGVVLPASVLERLAKFEKPEDQAKAGQEIAAEQVRWVAREGWAGLYLMSPASTAGVIDVLQARR